MDDNESSNGLTLNSLLNSEYFSDHTTLGIGGKIKYYYEAHNTNDLKTAIKFAIKNSIKYIVIGLGSDILANDKGYEGLVITNKVKGIKKEGDIVSVNSGEVLQDFIDYCIECGLSGNESMSGIPGTVGGAIYGNAGAYGQTISDQIVKVVAFNGNEVKIFSKNECKFKYRESIFKTNKYCVLSADFKLPLGDSKKLKLKSQEVIKLRSIKYPPGIKCPGSFFKNVLSNDILPEVLDLIPKDKIMYGKIPAGFLLESVGAKGAKLGQIEVATYHGNLFINNGKGTASDFLKLSNLYKQKVKEKYKIELEPEVQLIGF